MGKFGVGSLLPMTRLTQNFPSPTILTKSSGRNRCIQQMAHFVPIRCRTTFPVDIAIVFALPSLTLVIDRQTSA
jgi:hypothetical protein